MSQDAKRPFRALIITQDPDHARSLELGLAALDDWDWVRVSGPGEALALLPLNSFTVALMDAADKGGGSGADAHGIAEAVPVIAIASAPGAEGTPPRTQDLDWPHFSHAKLATLLASVAEAQGDALDGPSALDATTNLPAGRLFLEQARHCYGLARRQRTGLAALMLRLDSGDHEEAPAPWRAAATARIRDCLRESDLLGHASTNELAVLFPGVERPEELTALGKRILEGLRSVSLSFGPGIPRPSLGAALMGASPSHVESLLDCARKGVARSQALGGDCLHFDDPRLDEAAAQRFRYEVELRRGLVAGQFTLHWQPQATLGGAVTGAEVLLRWLHPDRRPVPPSEFIPFSES
jgi:predicted signal transduction protein with EAL and GGDEF domain